MKLLRNKMQCLKCGDILESKGLHHFVSCSCGNLSIDGGTECPRTISADVGKVKSLWEYKDE